jgi:N-methylhydantoinase A/acetone carboxylase, beta subunit
VSRYRVAMDIGGTFTDAVAYDEQTGAYVAGKASTTPADLAEGVVTALDAVVQAPGDIGFSVHGTTQGLNAFLQRRGVRVLLLATSGAGDVYHVARGNRTRLYDIHFRKPTPLVPRRDIVEIGGRLAADGRELEALDEEAVRAAARRALDEGFGAIAVAFLSATATRATRSAPRSSCARLRPTCRSRSPTAWRASGASTSAPPRRSSTPTPHRSCAATCAGSRTTCAAAGWRSRCT